MDRMREHTLFLCEAIIVDRSSLVSAINIFTTIRADRFPFTHSCWLFFHARGISGEHKSRFTMISPSSGGDEIELATQDFESSGPSVLNYVLWKVDLRLDSVGEHFVCAFVDGECVSQQSFFVEPRPEE